jgi:catechol 2,3-dioxygenase-like lactoylglutathione lyase family enzyme
MTIRRMDHVGIVVDDLAAATEFFVELGLELQGERRVEGRWVDRVVGSTASGQRSRCCRPRTARETRAGEIPHAVDRGRQPARAPTADWIAVRHGQKREGVWREPLGAVSPKSLEAEGFESFAHFRRAWCIREKRLFRPLHMTTVFRVRRWDSEDERAMADALLERLYGEFLAADNSRSYPSTGPPPCAVGT